MNELDGGNKLSLMEPDLLTGQTPLHMAVSSGEYAVIKYLILNKADKQARCNQKLTPQDKALQMK